MKLARLLPFLLLASLAFGTATVSGKLQNPDTTGAVPGFVQFDLQNCGSNAPTVSGATISPQQKFTLNADGTWSGVMARNDEISCNGSFTTWWHKSYFVNFRQVGPAMDYICSQASCVFDGTGGLTPITTYPAPAPAAPPAISLQPKLCAFTLATTWTCTHNFGVQPVIIQTFDSGWHTIIADTPGTATDLNTATAVFNQPTSGYMLVLYAGNSTLSILNPDYLVGHPNSSQTITGQGLTLTGSAPLTSAGANTFTGSNTFNGPLLTQALNNAKYCNASTAGIDGPARINTLDAQLGATPGVIFADQSCWPSTASTTFTLNAGHYLVFTQPGTYLTTGCTNTVKKNAGIGSLFLQASSIGTDQPPVVLAEAAGANCAKFIDVTDAFAALWNIVIDGGQSGNASAQDAIVIEGNGQQGAMSNIAVQNAKRYGINFNGTTGAGPSTTCCWVLISVTSIKNGSDGLFCQGSNDLGIGSYSQIQNNGGDGIELSNCPGVRMDGHTEVSGNNTASGNAAIEIYGTAGGLGSSNTQLLGFSMGNNRKHDILITGYDTVGGAYTSLGNIVCGIKFVAGQSPGRSTTNTYDNIRIIDGGQNTICDNILTSSNAPNQNKYAIELTETSAGRAFRNTISGNSYNNNAGTGYISDGNQNKSMQSANYEGSNNSQLGPNAYIPNNTYLLFQNAAGAVPAANGISYLSTNDLLIENTAAGRLIYHQINGVNVFTEDANASRDLIPANWALVWTEGAAAANGSGVDSCYGDSTAHALKCSFNNGSFLQIPQVITATSAAFATATTAGTCVQNTTAVTGATTAMSVAVSPVSTPGVGAEWSAFVSSAGNVTINECAVATSAGGTIAFNIRVTP